MSYDRNGGLGDDVGAMGPALGPGWREQHTAGTVTDSLRDAPITYDGWERLLGWIEKHYHGHPLMDSTVVAYTYDRTGNVAQMGDSATRFERCCESYDANDRLTARWEGLARWTYSYDAAGNLTTASSSQLGVSRTYGYDALNRLVSVRQNDTLVARYGYDVLGRRIVKLVGDSSPTGTPGYTRYIYAGQQVEYEADSAGSRTLKYLWGPGTDNLAVVRTASDSAYQVVTDQLGSVRMLVGADSAAAWRASWRYDPYGNLIDSSGSSPVTNFPYRWTGREYDAETGFYYLRARYYDPQAKRFTQEDPIGYGVGTNLYGYVSGHVLNSSDPSGTSECPDCPYILPEITVNTGPSPGPSPFSRYLYQELLPDDWRMGNKMWAAEAEALWNAQHQHVSPDIPRLSRDPKTGLTPLEPSKTPKVQCYAHRGSFAGMAMLADGLTIGGLLDGAQHFVLDGIRGIGTGVGAAAEWLGRAVEGGDVVANLGGRAVIVVAGTNSTAAAEIWAGSTTAMHAAGEVADALRVAPDGWTGTEQLHWGEGMSNPLKLLPGAASAEAIREIGTCSE